MLERDFYISSKDQKKQNQPGYHVDCKHYVYVLTITNDFFSPLTEIKLAKLTRTFS